MPVHDLFAYLHVADGEAAIRFYADAFGASELFRLVEPGTGRLGHAELKLGPATLMLSEPFPEIGIHAPDPDGPSVMVLHLHVDDADAVIAAAMAAGARLVRPAEDQFYGERAGTVRDPFGYDWMIGHAIEDVSPAEMQRRYDAMMAGTGEV